MQQTNTDEIMHGDTHQSQLPKDLILNLASQMLLELLHLLSDLSIHLLHVLPHRIILLWCIQPAEHNMFTLSKPQMCQSFIVIHQTKIWQTDMLTAQTCLIPCVKLQCLGAGA